MSELTIPTMAELLAKGEEPEILFWVGCAGSFDERAQKITRDICKILQHVGMKFAVLGNEESCTGDPAKRAGNEFLFQMQAMANIELLNAYNVQKIVTGCPHCFNTLRNEYPGLGGTYEVIHHSQLIQQLIDEGKLRAEGGESFKGKKITFHDPCYLGRANQVYEAPRRALEVL
ncbi:MAG: (Fe-S)-binding protein, partial [Sphingobacteriaceae bacterium]